MKSMEMLCRPYLKNREGEVKGGYRTLESSNSGKVSDSARLNNSTLAPSSAL